MFPQTLAISGNSREAAIDPIYVRPLRPDDRPALERWFATVSMASRYARFLGFVTELSPQMWRYLTEIDRHDHVAFVAFYDGRLAGVGRWIREDPDTAEIAFLVGDQVQRRGVGARLCQHLVAAAREHGVHRFRAYVLPDNRGIRRLLMAPAFATMRDRGGVIEVALHD